MAELAQDWATIIEELDRHRFRQHGSADRAGLPELMSQYDLPGLSIAVEQDGVGSWAAGFGTTATPYCSSWWRTSPTSRSHG